MPAVTFLRLIIPLHDFTFLLGTDDCLTDYTRACQFPASAFEQSRWRGGCCAVPLRGLSLPQDKVRVTRRFCDPLKKEDAGGTPAS
jgi:hypothetical protein